MYKNLHKSEIEKPQNAFIRRKFFKMRSDSTYTYVSEHFRKLTYLEAYFRAF